MLDQQDKLTLYVAPEGCDGWSGLQECSNHTDGPLASLAGARNRIRIIRQAGKLSTPVEVIFKSGRYEIDETIVFQDEDLSDAQTNVTFRGEESGEVILMGGCRLPDPIPLEGGLLKYELESLGRGKLKFDQLFCNGLRQHKARYPSFNHTNPYGGGWLYVEGSNAEPHEKGCGEKDRFICRDERLKQWNRIDQVELFIFPRHNWYNSIVKLKSYDAETGEVQLQEPACYEIYPGDRFYFQNIKEELSEPGEWYLDESQQTVYFYPPQGLNAEDLVVTIPLVEHMLEIRSSFDSGEDLYTEKIDWADSGGMIMKAHKQFDVQLGHIRFANLTLEGCDGTAVLAKRVCGLAIEGCVVRSTGGAGITLLQSNRSRIEGCDIYETGSHGIYASGGYKTTFGARQISSEIRIENNYIHHIGVIHKGVAGISVNGVGIEIVHNYIHDGPRWGIFSRGNDHLLAFNHIRHVNVETCDTGAINTCDRDWTMHGTRIEYNLIHDVLGYQRAAGVWHSPAFAFGIYLDDYTSGVEVRGNLTYRTPSAGMYVHSGKDIVIENNMFLDTREESIFVLGWPADNEFKHLGTRDLGTTNNRIVRNVFGSAVESSAPYKMCVRDFDNLKEKQNVFEDNVIWSPSEKPVLKLLARDEDYGTKADLIKWDDWTAMGHDQDSKVTAEPGFVNAAEDDYRLIDDSVVNELGFEPLPVDKMGLYANEKRASWPIREATGVRELPMPSKFSIPLPVRT